MSRGSQGGGSPTLYLTDRNTYVVQGWKVEDHNASVQIPHRLLAHVEPGTYLGALMADTGRGSFILSGQAVTDTEALSQADVPGHETCVESLKRRRSGSVELLQDEAQQNDDFAWHQPWLNLVRSVTISGKAINRARIVTVPHGDYTRWGLTVAPHNIAAGEDVRWLPRHLIDADILSTDDYWLFDDNLVVFTVFEPNGQFAGRAATSDPRIISFCRDIRDRVWTAAIPHNKYIDSEYVSA